MFAGATLKKFQVLRDGNHGSKRKRRSDLYTISSRGEQDHNKRCRTCLSGASREQVPKRERCSDSIVRSIDHGNKGRAIKANIAAALVKMLSVDEAWTILSSRTCNLDAKAKIVKANILPALIAILETDQARN
ncbi:hypothetical protein Bca4012_020355 [Brassica carinata]|uniref:Uncharacterized protein n=1 Tax=Brassica carinata TaxID=52824 RepID=A0A8X8BDQ6_BRACI|nr:hypothetical protein Bca52824_001267 [Brassica carinata]